MSNHLLDYLPGFVEALTEQLESDQKRWGDTWIMRTREGQEQRIEDDYHNYFDQFNHAGVPVPWLKVVGNAFIAWVRENNPELFPKG